MAKVTNVVLTQLYPKVEKSMKANMNQWKKLMSNFFQQRSEALYDIAPIDRIYFNQEDENNFYNALKISKAEVTEIIQKIYYYDEINNRFDIIVKDEHSILALTVIRYFIMKNDKKNTELAGLYLAFSGKIYASAHYNSFEFAPTDYRHVMEYAINNMSNKYDIVREGSVIGAVRSLTNTYLDSYKSRFKDFDDDDVSYLLQQLKNRVKAFIINIAKEYYETYKNKDYITYDSDDLSDNNFHLSDSDSLKLERNINKAINKIESSTTDFRLCKISADDNVRTDELKSIIDSIMTKPENFTLVKELVRNICTYYFLDGKKKDVTNAEFIAFSISPKPNSKDKLYLRNKEIIEQLLLSNSEKYAIRSKRVATKISYNTVLLKYFIYLIHDANK